MMTNECEETMADNAVELKLKAKEAIDSNSAELYDLNKKIWENPELCFKEKYAHSQLTEFLAARGFDVTPHYTMDTAFRAETGENGGLTIGLICEYDALPEVGHACGHNLIAESGVAAALGLKIALEGVTKKTKVKIVLLGTPAEEGGGGKVLMIESGCFKDIDFCMMVHPSPIDLLKPIHLAIETVIVTYKGFAAHAAAFPYEGINALDAAVLAYNSISALRQQMKPTWRVHGIISEGGVKPNIIPDRAQLIYYIRAPADVELKVLKGKIINCFQAAAKATGCQVAIEWDPMRYSSMDTNPTLADLYKANAESLGVKYDKSAQAEGRGSTDMGNVSHVVPATHILYAIDTEAGNHSHAFTAAAATEAAHNKTLIASKAMAMTAIDVICDPELLKQIKKEFKKSDPATS
ncbi:peptidase M20 domain-containing protein 2-like [Acropora millepora]|uniref:peptidase M20 domain-containing protein 2-like n=1 Tax=Acropora millepora TaxID=45264 RepID=UPI001CF182D7|nr:peptidase M20 domain-containing protein 2-like [Acropora millepora]